MSTNIVDFNILNSNFNINSNTVLVILPIYNRKELIIESINSIVNQDYKDVLLHIIDDNSTQNVINLISNYINQNNISNIILSRNNVNSGPYININHILKYHINDNFGFWALQGSDDVSNFKRLSTVVGFLNENKNFKACRSKYIRGSEDNIPKYGDTMLICTKQVFYDIGYYDNNRFGADTDYSKRVILKYGSIGEVPATLYYARLEPDRLTNTYTVEDRKKYVEKINFDHSIGLYRNFTTLNRDSIICGVATIKERVENLKLFVNSIISQVDKLIVYQNGYYELFEFLKHPKIEVYSSIMTNIDMGDAGKFYRVNEFQNCYYLSCDDDIIYPKNYVNEMIKSLKKYDNNIIVSHHGRIMKKNAIDYYNDIDEGFRCLDDTHQEKKIDFGGTGVMGFHTNKVNGLDFSYFKEPNMADIWVGKFAAENGISIFILPHNKGWIKSSLTLDETNTISKKYRQTHTIQNKILSEIRLIKKKFKVVVLTCTWQRPEITEIFVNCLLSTQEKTKNIFEYVNIVVDSENSNLNVFKHRTSDFNYYNFPNTPISNKWNYGVSLTKNIDFDYIIFLGSDDIIDENLMLEYYNKMKDGNDFIGIIDMYVFNYLTNQLYYWDGYKKNTGRQGETIGLGRCLSKKTIEKLNYTLWAPNINEGLDKTFNNNISKLKSVKISNIRLTEFDGFACDIKGGVNITKIELYSTDLIKVNNNIILRSIPKLGTFKTDINDLSIIIPTYKNTQYLDKCFNSIIDSIGDKNVEVLVGVDSCVETFNFLIGKIYPNNFKFYFFEKNVGPYVVKNSLSKISKSNNILFFDSDDIMDKNMVGDVIDGLNGYDCVKPVYIDFNDGDIININSKKHLGEGVFGIKKSIFNYLNGFEPWMCAADSDFMGRLYKNRYKLKFTNKINFYRRIHKNGLTSRPDTGMSSPLRAQYAKLSRNKKVAGPLKIMVTEPYSLITGVNYLPKMDHVNEDKNLVGPNYELMLKLRKETLDKVFNHENYRVAPPVEKIEKKISSINYEKINNLLNKVIPKPIPKVKQVNNTPENKKIITNKEMVKLTFPGKKNRRSGDNTMSFGGKINK